MRITTSSVSTRLCCPFEPLQGGAAQYPVLVALGQEIERFCDMGEPLAPTPTLCIVRRVGAPVAALRPESADQAADVLAQIFVRIRLERRIGQVRELDADVGILDRKSTRL